MKTVTLLIVTFLLLSCVQSHDNKKLQQPEKGTLQQHYLIPQKIKIDGLKNVLLALKNEQTKYSFIGITSNGIDCIYFVYEDDLFDVEFEAMGSEQLPYIEIMKKFAMTNKFAFQIKTYNNKPQYISDIPAPVIRIVTKFSLDKMVEFGEKIQKEVFKNDRSTVYEIVP
jgi:hypothetical protein